MTTSTTASTTSNVVRPADYGEPTAFQLGDFRGLGTIHTPAHAAMRMVAAGRDAFDFSDGVQFFFNGTPAVVRSGDTIEAVARDWSERRARYQKAAGII